MKDNLADRNSAVDIMKGLGIFLVVFAHLYSDADTVKWIYSFHMPLFFFISGYLFKINNLTVKKQIKKKAVSLLIPYLIFYILTYVYWLTVERSLIPSHVEWWQPIIGLFYGAAINSWMSHNVVLWFLPALFTVEMIFLAIYKRTQLTPLHMLIAVVAVVILGIVMVDNGITGLPWGATTACIATGFYAFGYFFRQVLPNIIKVKYLVIMLITSIIAEYLLPTSTTRLDMSADVYGDWILFILYACVGIVLVFAVSHILKTNKIIQWVGVNSLVIMCLHNPIMRFILVKTSNITNLSSLALRSNTLIAISISIVAILTAALIALLYNKYVLSRLRKL